MGAAIVGGNENHRLMLESIGTSKNDKNEITGSIVE